MSDVRLVGTNPDDGSLVPVSVTPSGMLRTSIGKIESIPNDVVVAGKLTAASGQINGDLSVTGQVLGSDGQPIGGDDFELPPDPQNGQVLGWNNGELVWMDGGSNPFFFYLDLLVAAAGGQGGTGDRASTSGGGAGGFFQTRAGYQIPGDKPAPGAVRVALDPLSAVHFSLSAGSWYQNSSFSGNGLDISMIVGGDGGSRGHGGSGGGGNAPDLGSMTPYLAGQGNEGQGNSGADGYAGPYNECAQSDYTCHQYCIGRRGGGGGGAGGPASGYTHGPGLESDITGAVEMYCVGGNGSSICSTEPKPPMDGGGKYGDGGSETTLPGKGVVILRYPDFIELTVVSGSVNRTDSTVNTDTVSVFEDGSADIRFAVKPEVVMSTVIDYLRRFRD